LEVKGVNLVVLPVSDWAASREWYTSKLGCKPVEEYPEDGYGEYTLGGGAAIGLWALPKKCTVLHGDGAKLVAPLPYIEVDGLEAAVEELKALGVEFVQVLSEGEYKTASFRDPDGHVLFLFELAR